MKRPISGNNYLEQHNDDMVEELSSKISTLKRVTIAIGDDVREQNRLLSDMVCELQLMQPCPTPQGPN